MLVALEEDEEDFLQGTPWAVYTLIAINFVIFLAVVFLPSYEHILNTFGFTPARWTWLAAVTSMFLHAGFWHVAGNMFFLWMFGDNVEDVLGAAAFLGVYLLSGFAATAVHYCAAPDSTVPCVGASGAISGVLAVYVALFPWRSMHLSIWLGRLHIRTFQTRAMFAGVAWFAEQTVLAMVGISEYIGIAFWAHIGGFAAGALLGLVLRYTGALERYRKRPWGQTIHLRARRHRAPRRGRITVVPPKQ